MPREIKLKNILIVYRMVSICLIAYKIGIIMNKVIMMTSSFSITSLYYMVVVVAIHFWWRGVFFHFDGVDLTDSVDFNR